MTRFGRLIAIVALLASLLACGDALAQTRIAVLFPDSAPAVTKLYRTIIDGMAAAGDVRIESRAVSESASPDEIKAWVLEQRSHAMVILGDVPPASLESLPATMTMVRGASALNDNAQSGVSLASSPAQVFNRLRQIKPDVERLFVVYRPQSTGWLLAAARAAARDIGLELNASACDDVQQSVAAFGRILQQARPGKDAIWLTLDPVVPINQMLPVLLRESWDRHLLLVSNNPMDVAKGALFALYPDYPAMGRQLAERVKRQIARPALSGPEPSERLRSAINVRTASHLGIVPGERELQGFDRVFPEEQR